MWYFEAIYEDVNTYRKVARNIQFDGQFFKNEKECYMYAVDIAYSQRKENECLVSLQFIAC